MKKPIVLTLLPKCEFGLTKLLRYKITKKLAQQS